jgi:hypothetical protein
MFAPHVGHPLRRSLRKNEIAMRKLVVPIAFTILATLGTISAISSFRPCKSIAALPPHGILIEEIQRRVDMKSLPDLEITDLY